MAYQNEPLANFENLPEWRKVQLNSLAEQGSGFLSIEGQDPEIFKGIDIAESAVAVRSSHMQLKAYHEGMSFWRSLVYCRRFDHVLSPACFLPVQRRWGTLSPLGGHS